MNKNNAQQKNISCQLTGDVFLLGITLIPFTGFKQFK